MDERELDRIDRDNRDRAMGRLSPSTTPSSAWLGRVTSTPNVVGKFMGVRPVTLLGAEASNATGDATDAGTVDRTVYLVGPGTPAVGDEVIVRWSDWRWVASRRKVAAGTCTITRTYTRAVCGPRAGITVTLKLAGVTIATAVTDSAGTVSFTGLNPGSYTLTTDATTGYAASSTSVTLATCPTTSTGSVSTPLATGYICCGAATPELILQSSLPATLTLTRSCAVGGSGSTPPNFLNRQANTCTWSTGSFTSLVYQGGGVFHLTNGPCESLSVFTGADIYAINLSRTYPVCCGASGPFSGDLTMTITP